MSRPSAASDPRFRRLSGVLESRAAAHAEPSTPPDSPAAAVALLLRANDPLEVLLIKRARSERDPWSGQMALPGGRRDPHDASLLATAMRETEEEVGIRLEGNGAWLGRLNEVATQSPRLPRLLIQPFVFGVPERVRGGPVSEEVDAIHWVTLEALASTAGRGTVEIPLPGGSRSFPCVRVAGEAVWGLTYRILTQFLDLLREADPC